MDKHSILYIGPYNEVSNRGRLSLSYIRGLHQAGHNIKTVPVYYPAEKFVDTPDDIKDLESNDLDKYDICFQHCDPMQFCFNKNFDKNIGIYTPTNITNQAILNTKLNLLDHIIVSSDKIYDGLKHILAPHIHRKVKPCPYIFDVKNVTTQTVKELDWIEEDRYYFYTELEFTEEYDWEKLLYTYISTFINKKTGLIIRTSDIKNEYEAGEITMRISQLAYTAGINIDEASMPKVLNGDTDDETSLMFIKHTDCMIECGRTHDYNTNLFKAAALRKDIISNDKLAASDFFSNNKVVGIPCHINYNNHQDKLSSDFYNKHYTMDPNSLREQMLTIHYGRHQTKPDISADLEKYDIRNLDRILF